MYSKATGNVSRYFLNPDVVIARPAMMVPTTITLHPIAGCRAWVGASKEPIKHTNPEEIAIAASRILPVFTP